MFLFITHFFIINSHILSYQHSKSVIDSRTSRTGLLLLTPEDNNEHILTMLFLFYKIYFRKNR